LPTKGCRAGNVGSILSGLIFVDLRGNGNVAEQNEAQIVILIRMCGDEVRDKFLRLGHRKTIGFVRVI
jgi:hypothetical protein